MKYIWNKSSNKFELSEFVVKSDTDREIAVNAGYVEVSDENYEKLAAHELCWENGQLIPYVKTQTEKDEELRQQEIVSKKVRLAELKGLLVSWDYKTSKHADGDYTEAEWQEIVNQRKAWRAEINNLEAELANR